MSNMNPMVQFWCDWCQKPPSLIGQYPPDYINDCIPFIVKCHNYEETGNLSIKELQLNGPIFVRAFRQPHQLEFNFSYAIDRHETPLP